MTDMLMNPVGLIHIRFKRISHLHKRLQYLLKKTFFCYLISDDTHDGTTSSLDNGPSKDDE